MEYNLHLRYIRRLNEDNKDPEDPELIEPEGEKGPEGGSGNNLKDALNIIKEKVGGDFKKDSRRTAIIGLKDGLDLLEVEDIEENGEEIKQIFLHLSKKEVIEFLEHFVRSQKNRVQTVSAKLKKEKDTFSESEFKKQVNIIMNVIERVYKLHSIIKNNLSLIPNSTEEEKKQYDSVLNKLKKVMANCEKAIAEKMKIIQDEAKDSLDDAVETSDPEEAEEKINRVEKTFDDLGLKDLISELISQIRSEFESKKKKTEPIAREKEENPEEKKKKRSISRKKRTITKILDSLKLAMLPELDGDAVKTGGGYYALYTALSTKNRLEMDNVINTKVFKTDQKFEKQAFLGKKSESGSEEDQLSYLNSCRYWTLWYIESGEDGQIESQRELEKLLTEINNVADEKEKEIKNYYTAKDFNLGQFKGLQIKPQIRLPLCLSRTRSEADCEIKLPITYEDRVNESPLKKFYLGATAIVGGLFSNIPDNSDTAFAAKAAARNQAVISGISSIISGTLGLYSKQASRDYETGVENVKKRVKETFARPKGGLKEDMLAMPAPVPTQPGQFLQTPDSVPSGMDTFALLGPGGTGKKPTKKKKKPMKTIPQRGGVMSFDAFLKQSKNIK